MIKEILKLANHLDAKGHRKEADYLDAVIRKIAGETWPMLRTQGKGVAETLMSGVHRCCGRRSSESQKLLDSVPAKENADGSITHNTIYYDIANGEITTSVEPQDNNELVEVANKLAAIIKSSVVSKLPTTYKDWKLKKGSEGKPSSEHTAEDYEKVDLPIGPSRILFSTDKSKNF
jgi:hypothetical protein